YRSGHPCRLVVSPDPVVADMFHAGRVAAAAPVRATRLRVAEQETAEPAFGPGAFRPVPLERPARNHTRVGGETRPVLHPVVGAVRVLGERLALRLQGFDQPAGLNLVAEPRLA